MLNLISIGEFCQHIFLGISNCKKMQDYISKISSQYEISQICHKKDKFLHSKIKLFLKNFNAFYVIFYRLSDATIKFSEI